MTPSDARNQANYQHVHNALYAKDNARKVTSPKFHVGEKVRITRKKGTFWKGFTPNWTEKVFTISSVKATKPPTCTIKDTLGEPVQGTFYEQELQLSAREIFRIERVLKKKKKNHESYLLHVYYTPELDNLHDDKDIDQLELGWITSQRHYALNKTRGDSTTSILEAMQCKL